MGKNRWLGTGSVLHPRHERPRRSSGGMVDSVSVSSGGGSSKPTAQGPKRHTSQQTLAVEDSPRREGVVVSPIEGPSESGLTTAGRFRVGK